VCRGTGTCVAEPKLNRESCVAQAPDHVGSLQFLTSCGPYSIPEGLWIKSAQVHACWHTCSDANNG